MKIVGHGEIIGDFKKLAAKGGLSHGYIFHGPAMVGKRTTAQALAKFLEKGFFEPVTENEILQDAKLVGPEAAKDSIGVDAAREVKHFLWQKPNASSKRTLIIDNAGLLTTEAQNALLKVTEEPPTSSLLILVTSETESLMPTLLSRLQRIYFGAVPEKEIAGPFAKKSLGRPGLAWKLANDKQFQESLALAEHFLKTTPANRRDFIKKLIEQKEFSLRNFLDTVIITLAWEKSSKMKAVLWHKTLALQESVTNFSLNPRLQLENLLMDV